MDSSTQGFTSYWCSTSADAESGRGASERREEESFTKRASVGKGRLGEDVVELFFNDEDTQVKAAEVLLRSEVWIRLLKHGKARVAGAPDTVIPLVTAALLSREDLLFPTSPATIPRDLLEPLPKGTFSTGEMTEHNKYGTTHDSIISGSGNEDELREKTNE